MECILGLLRYFILVVTICLTGCMAQQIHSDLSRQMQVFGVGLYSGIDYREIDGVAASEEPCLKGYVRSFDTLDISVGYGFDKKIRTITTRNPGTSMFRISPGMPAEEGGRLALQAGLREVAPSRYQGKEIDLTLLIDSRGKIFGITVERRE